MQRSYPDGLQTVGAVWSEGENGADQQPPATPMTRRTKRGRRKRRLRVGQREDECGIERC